MVQICHLSNLFKIRGLFDRNIPLYVCAYLFCIMLTAKSVSNFMQIVFRFVLVVKWLQSTSGW